MVEKHMIFQMNDSKFVIGHIPWYVSSCLKVKYILYENSLKDHNVEKFLKIM